MVLDADRRLRARMPATPLALPAVAPPDPASGSPVGLDSEGECEATYHYRSERLTARFRAATATHPSLDERVDRLRAAERELEAR